MRCTTILCTFNTWLHKITFCHILGRGCKIYFNMSSLGAVLKICIKGQCERNTDSSSTCKITGRCMICFQVLSYLIGMFHLSHKTLSIWHLLRNKNSIKVQSNTKRTILFKNEYMNTHMVEINGDPCDLIVGSIKFGRVISSWIQLARTINVIFHMPVFRTIW